MYSAVTDSSSFSQIEVSVLSLRTLVETSHTLTTLVCAGSLLTYSLMRGVEAILWVLGGSKYGCSSVTYIYKDICLFYYFSTLFHQLDTNYNARILYV